MLKVNLNFLKKNKPWANRVKAWVGKRPLWLKFVVSVFLVSLLTSLAAIGLYDRFYGSSPWSNKMRLVNEALKVCNQAQTLAYTAVDFGDWPLESTSELEGATVIDVVNYLESSAENGPSAAQVATATAWLQEKYSDYFTAKDLCDTLAQEYQEKYSY